jgi:hypothetical protein
LKKILLKRFRTVVLKNHFNYKGEATAALPYKTLFYRQAKKAFKMWKLSSGLEGECAGRKQSGGDLANWEDNKMGMLKRIDRSLT